MSAAQSPAQVEAIGHQGLIDLVGEKLSPLREIRHTRNLAFHDSQLLAIGQRTLLRQVEDLAVRNDVTWTSQDTGSSLTYSAETADGRFSVARVKDVGTVRYEITKESEQNRISLKGDVQHAAALVFSVLERAVTPPVLA